MLDEGPLTDYESWMPDFIGGLAKGIEKSRGMIENAMNGVTSDLTITPRVMAAQGGYSGSAASSGDLISGIMASRTTPRGSRAFIMRQSGCYSSGLIGGAREEAIL